MTRDYGRPTSTPPSGSSRFDRPILSGWSYGPLVMLDYIRHYGEERIGGIHFVGAVTKLGSEAAAAVLTPEFLALLPGLFSSDVVESVRGIESLLHLCFAREPEASDRYTMLGFGVSVAPFVRQALLACRRQRRPPADHREARADHAWRARRDRCGRKPSRNTAWGCRTRRFTSCRTQGMPRSGTMPHR